MVGLKVERGRVVRSIPCGEKEVNSSGYSHGAGKFRRSEQWCKGVEAVRAGAQCNANGHYSLKGTGRETGHPHPGEFSSTCCSFLGVAKGIFVKWVNFAVVPNHSPFLLPGSLCTADLELCAFGLLPTYSVCPARYTPNGPVFPDPHQKNQSSALFTAAGCYLIL